MLTLKTKTILIREIDNYKIIHKSDNLSISKKDITKKIQS